MAKKKSTKKKPTKKKTTKKQPPKKKTEDEQPPAAEESQPIEDQPGEEIPEVEKEMDLGSSLESGLQDELLKNNNELTLQNDKLRAANEHLTNQVKQVVTAYKTLEDKVIELTQQPAPAAEPTAPQPQAAAGPPQQPAPAQPQAAADPPQQPAPQQPPAAPPESAEDRIARIEEILITTNQAMEGMIGILQRAGLYAPSGSQQVQQGGQVPIPLGGQVIPGQPGQPGTLKDAAGQLALSWLKPENKEQKLLDALYTNAIKNLTGPAEDPFAEMGKEAFTTLIRKGLGGIGGPTAQDQYNIAYAKERAKVDAKRIGTMLPTHED